MRWVLIRDPLGEYETVCLLCTDPDLLPLQSSTGSSCGGELEVTFEEARRHLGIETQRQWSDKAIARTTPLLLGLFSWVTLLAHALYSSVSLSPYARPPGIPNPYPPFPTRWLWSANSCGLPSRLSEYRRKNPI